jgi:hypothetical protein
MRRGGAIGKLDDGRGSEWRLIGTQPLIAMCQLLIFLAFSGRVGER